jgi:hypothetical protein
MRVRSLVLRSSLLASLLLSALGCAPELVSVDATSRPDATSTDAAVVAPDAVEGEDAGVRTDAAPTDAPPARDAAPTRCDVDAGGEAPTFRALYTDVIEPHGCVECHRAGEHWSTLDLSSVETAYADLIGVTGCDDVTPRVTPCDPSASTFSIVPGLRAEPCGGRHTHSSPTYTGILSEDGRARVDAWIAAGAAY